MCPSGLLEKNSYPSTITLLPLLQEIFPTQGSNPGLPRCRRILYQLSHKRSPRIVEWVAYPFSRRTISLSIQNPLASPLVWSLSGPSSLNAHRGFQVQGTCQACFCPQVSCTGNFRFLECSSQVFVWLASCCLALSVGITVQKGLLRLYSIYHNAVFQFTTQQLFGCLPVIHPPPPIMKNVIWSIVIVHHLSR